MNKLSREERARILSLLCEGNSIRAVTRLLSVGKNTVIRLMLDAGKACAVYHDGHIHNLKSKRIQCDEIWSFVAAKQKNVVAMKTPVSNAGDIWTWTALDADSKLIVSYFIGDRSAQSAIALMDDLCARLSNRIQLTTDGHRPYLEAVEGAFGADVDYAVLEKIYGTSPESAKGRYSPAECIGAKKKRIEDNPEMGHVSTSYVERSNLTIRMQNRRFTRLTNAFSKKAENHAYSVALFVMFYNFCRIHKTLRVTPAMEAGVTDRLWSVEDIAALVEAAEAAPKKRGPYKKKAA
ncbi:MAG TPA: IS1 family transposase [Methylovirgula sp.]|nr:IS1 family transposase [Methylovirgula sp.]